MKKKKIVALLLATSVIATSPALFTNPMMVLAEEAEGTSGEQIEVNAETIATNTSTIVTNAKEGTITTNEGKVNTNYGTIETNTEEGTVDFNGNTVTSNEGSITTNQGYVTSNQETGTIETNYASVTDNYGTVNDNEQFELDGEVYYATINNNYGTVDNNNASIITNNGTVVKNEGTGMYEEVRQDTSLDYSETTGIGIKYNNGVVTNNVGDILNNTGTVETNNGNILINDTNSTNIGTITTNNGEVKNNFGTIDENNGFVSINKENATIEKNNTEITDNYGTVSENAKGETVMDGGFILNNHSTVNVNNGWVWNNNGTILDNNGFVSENRENGTVIIDIESNIDESGTITFDTENNGRVSGNSGIVEIIIDAPATDDEIEKIVNNTVRLNYNEIDVKNSDEVIAKYYGISGYNGLTGEDYFHAYLDSVKENNTYTFSIPSGCGVDGNVILSKDNTTLEVIGDALETNEDGDYIVPVGTKFKVTGTATFLGKWYKILQSSGAIVEVVQDTSSNDDTPTQPTPVVKDFTTSIAGVEINSWEDVSTVMNTKADTIIAEPNSDFKLFKLELSKKQLTIPTSVVSNVATSQVDGLHCFIGDGDAITFIDNGTLGNYVPTDFTHSDKVTNDMKIISFEKPQAIGATVLLSTRVPAKNAPVAIWMLVDGKYELIGVDVSNATGNIAFPISSTGQFVLTY